MAVSLPSAAATADAHPPGALRTLGRAVLRLVGFWWLATGLIVATQRDQVTRGIALVAACGLAALGLRLTWRTRDDLTPKGAQVAFIGAAFLWIFVQTSFYGGWLVGPALAIPASQGPTPALAMHAIAATAWNMAAAAAAFGWCYAIHGTNRMGWLTLGTFWATDQLAKLNVFLGVANPGTHFLPSDLSFLVAYFGPQRNSLLLPVSVVVLAALSAWLYRRVLRDRDGYAREANALLATLLALAAFEVLVLGLPIRLPLWDVFLDARGS